MIKYWLNKAGSRGLKLSLLTMVLFIAASCNKEFENRLDLSAKPDSVTGYKSPKVLYIIIDGARGMSLNTIQAPTITEMTENALQTFNSVSDESGLAATTWADMLTGVKKEKHKVTQADFSGNNLTNYPMFFKQIKEKNAEIRTAAFSSTPAFGANLVSNADVNQNFNDNDAAVKEAVINELKDEKAGVVLAEFNSVDKAGQQYGYDASVPEYSTAILTIDTYIKEALETLKQRKNYEAENWLVVVASNQGGDYPVAPADDDRTRFSKPLLNSFVLLYNPRFSYQFYAKPNTAALPYEGKAFYLAKDSTANVPADKSSAYNFGTTGEYTVEFKLKVVKFGTLNAPIFFKSESPANSKKGWWIIHNGSNGTWRLGGLASKNLVGNQPVLKVGQWYTLGFKIYMENNKRWVVLYQDGVKASDPVDITGRDVTNSEELVAGYRSGYGNAASQYITDIRIFDVAVPDITIASYACKTIIDEKHPYYNNLIGYWPGTDGVEAAFKDKSPLGNDFKFKGSYRWDAFSDYQPNLCVDLPEDIYTHMPNIVDIPNFIFGWMGVKSLGLNLDGKTWVPVYNDVKPN